MYPKRDFSNFTPVTQESCVWKGAHKEKSSRKRLLDTGGFSDAEDVSSIDSLLSFTITKHEFLNGSFQASPSPKKKIKSSKMSTPEILANGKITASLNDRLRFSKHGKKWHTQRVRV